MNTIKVKPWGEGQGDFVLINAEDFDPELHVRLDAADTNGDGKVSIAEIRNALTAKGIEFDPKAKKPELQALLEKAEQIEALKAQLTEKGVEFAPDATLETLQQLLEGAE